MYYKKQELLTLREHMRSSPISSGDRVAHLLSFVCCVLLVYLSQSYVSNVASVSGLSFLGGPFSFLLTFISILLSMVPMTTFLIMQ